MKHINDLNAVARPTLARHPRRFRMIAVAAALAALVGGSMLTQPADGAMAADYPSWNDVQNARRSVAAKQAEEEHLKSILAGLQTAVVTTQAEAEKKGTEAQVAQQNYDEAAQKAAALQKQADAAQAKAAKSKQRAGQLAAQLSRSSGDDLSTTLFFSGSTADDLLSQLGLASMVKDQSAGLYEKAMQDGNTAQALTDQANVAKDALQVLADAAQKALEAAAAAAAAAQTALDEQQANQARVEAQLATLVDNLQHEESEYVAGIKAQWGASAGLGAGEISATGWARPSGGHISSPYGYRLDPYTHEYALHSGTDLGAACGAPIFAAHSGVVVYAGPFGGYGNYVKISNNDGSNLFTAYGHIVNGGTLVHVGEEVGVGQNIAKVGSTGWSTGCHLHFEVYRGSGTQDPVPFMRGQGVELAN